MTQLSLRGIRKRFGSAIAVDGISLEVSAGEFVTLLGGSGSGKTTTLMLIAGFYTPDEGKVWVSNNDVTEIPVYRRDLGLVYQHYALFPHMTVAKNVAFPLEMRHRSKAETGQSVARMLDLMRLSDFQDRLPSQLSGGQQQRVALARALVYEPPLLLMDEPLGALDKKLRDEMQLEIKSIQKRLGTTTIYVTHDQEEALTLSDRIVIMNRGRIEQIGLPQDLYERPRTRFVAEFMGATNCLSATAVSTAADRRAVVRLIGGATLTVHGSPAINPGAAVLVVVRPERVRISNLSTRTEWSCPGRVLEATYVGGSIRYQVGLDSGERLTALRPNLGESPFAQGDPIMVWWEPSDAWLIAE